MSDLNVLFISIDSLRRDFLGAYDKPFEWVEKMDVKTDNLDRFAERAAIFDSHYAGSLPCMPARREWLTGVQEFLWRPWGPIESFDTTIPQHARENDILAQLITDHFHYFQHGAYGYFEDFHGFEFIRGHEYDAWKTTPYDPDDVLLSQIGYEMPDSLKPGQDDEGPRDLPGQNAVPTDPYDLQDILPRWAYARNVDSFEDESDFFTAKVFSETATWLDENQDWDQWFLYVDEFDVHEPFHCPEPYASMYTDEDPRDPELTVWTLNRLVGEEPGKVSQRDLNFTRAQFAGKVTMVDHWFGGVLDSLDENDLWDETVVIVTSDHGYMHGEHEWVGKPTAPDYNEIVQTPLLIWHPDSPHRGDKVSALTSAVDVHSTILDALGTDLPESGHSQSFLPVLLGETEDHRYYALYGWWASGVSITDGRYTYLRHCRADVETDCFSTSQMNEWGWMAPRRPKTDAVAGTFLPYTDTPVWRFSGASDPSNEEPLLFDCQSDPQQMTNIAESKPGEAGRMRDLLVEALDEYEAPESQYERLALAEYA